MAAQATKVAPTKLINAAKAATVAYNNKDWTALKDTLTPDFVYDEIATGRVVQGADSAIALFQGWATALPDSAATFHQAYASGDTVILEVTWRGTHQGPLQTPKGPIPPSGKRIDVRACIVCEMAGEKVKVERQYFDMATLMRQIGAAG